MTNNMKTVLVISGLIGLMGLSILLIVYTKPKPAASPATAPQASNAPVNRPTVPVAPTAPGQPQPPAAAQVAVPVEAKVTGINGDTLTLAQSKTDQIQPFLDPKNFLPANAPNNTVQPPANTFAQTFTAKTSAATQILKVTMKPFSQYQKEVQQYLAKQAPSSSSGQAAPQLPSQPPQPFASQKAITIKDIKSGDHLVAIMAGGEAQLITVIE